MIFGQFRGFPKSKNSKNSKTIVYNILIVLLDVHALKVQTKVVACCPQGRPCFRMCWNQGVFVEMLVVGDGRGGALVPTLPSAS